METQDAVYEAFRKAETLALANEETELREFFSRFFYEVSDTVKGSDTLLYAKKLDLMTIKETGALYLWSAEPVEPAARAVLRNGVILIEGKDIKQEYISRFLSNCSI